MMRIIFCHTPPDLYGASRSLLRLTSRLVRDGHAVLVILGADGPLRQLLEQEGVAVRLCPRLAAADRRNSTSTRGLLELGANFAVSSVQLWRPFSEFQPDIVHTNTSLILTPGIVARMRGIPHIWHVREIFSDVPRMWRFYQWYVAAFATRIVCASQAVANQFSTRIRRDKVIVLHNGIPAEEFAEPSRKRIKAFRDRQNVNGHALVGLVGRIKLGRKGQDVFLDAAAALVPRFPEARFLLIGSVFPGNEAHLEKLQSMIRERGLAERIRCTGEVDDIKAAYGALDISVQASVLPEAFSGVVVESMAMGKPVVATRCGGTEEQIEDRVSGFLVAPGDPRALAAALESLLRDSELRQRVGAAGRQQFLERFEFEAFYRKVRALQDSMLPGAGY